MKQFLAALLASALTLPLIGCASPVAAGGPLEDNPLSGGLGKTPALTGYTLAAPAYPEFPARPLEPDNGDWEAYDKAYQAYRQALDTLRDGGISPEVQAGLTAFAGRSTPLALAGHQGENAIYSPLSLWSALAMLAQCAGGSSRQQILDALDCAGTDTLQAQVSQVWKGLYTEDGISSLMLANSIWLNSALEGTYVPATLDTLSKHYYAGTYAVPMGTTEADQAVTEWVKEQTHGLIGGDSPVIQTSGETLALLASSLYYRAGWRDEFLSSLTKQDTFTDAAGQESHVDFMHRSEQGSFLREEGWQAARLGTQLGEMVFVLPDQGVSPESLLQDPDFLSRLEISGEGSRYGEIRWSMPKFDVNSDLKLLDSLKALGITDVLDTQKADLSSLTTLDAYLSDAKQLARVKVDEEGVEAAAVTLLMMETMSAMPDPDQEVCIMDLDRPFLFVIRVQNIPLFVGVVNSVEA